MKAAIVLALTLISFSAIAKDHKWQTGTLFDMTSEKGKTLVGHYHAQNGYANGHLRERRDDATYYSIESGDMIYIVKRTLTSRGDKQLNLTINGPVKFCIEKEDVYLLDDDGKEHKLSLESKRIKEKNPT